MADLFENRTARLLVVQDFNQQPENLSPQASLPSLLQHLGSHCIEMVVFPLKDIHAQEVQTTWVQLLEDRDLEYKLQEDPKGNILQLIVNP